MAMAMFSLAAFGQDASNNTNSKELTETDDDVYASSSVGIGIGFDYGGLGLKFSGAVSEPVALFAGLGYNFNGAGFNGGATFRLSPRKRIIPTLTAMYGYNAVIVVEDGYGNEDYSETFYGPTFGIGVEFHGKYRTKNFFNLELLIPIRSQKYHDKMDDLDTFGVDINDLPPVGVALGYHFGW